MSDTTNSTAQKKQNIKAAHKMVSALCHREREWIMSVPARPDYDPDLVIGQALRDADRLAERVEALESAIKKHFEVTAIPLSMVRPTEQALMDLVKE